MDKVLHCLVLLEEDWGRFKLNRDAKLQMALGATIIIGGFSRALWGEEMLQMELRPMRKHWTEAMNHRTTPHIPLVLYGRFKSTQGNQMFFLPLTCWSKAGIEIWLWMHMLLEAYSAIRVDTRPMFRVATKGEKVWHSRMGDLELLFHAVLLRVQERWP